MAVTNKFRSGGKRFGYQRGNVLRRDNCRCIECGSDKDIVVHHLIPYEVYNEHSIQFENMVVLCHICHARIHGASRKVNNVIFPSNREKLKEIGFIDLLKDYIDLLRAIENGRR